MRVLKDIEPKDVWFWFEEICGIPRPSGSETRIADFLVKFAVGRGLRWRRDDADNVLIVKEGQGEAAGRQPVALQAHVDMVPEKKQGSNHDFNSDPIIPVVKGDWVTAPDTTLGADNGIGVSLMLAVLDSDRLSHPRIECLFTTDEERGLTGASSLDPDWLTARRLINLDSEDQGVFTIGCAGGSEYHLGMEVGFPGNAVCRKLRVSGLKGGHSGIEINRSRGNAIHLLARALVEIRRETGCALGSMTGGSKRNAIPREAEAMVGIPPGEIGRAEELLDDLARRLFNEYTGIEDRISLDLAEAGSELPILEDRTAGRIVDLLLALPHGVEKMSGVIPGLVETSVNLALLSLDGSGLSVDLSVRSPLESARMALGDRIAAIGELAGCLFSAGGSYPGWMPDSNSEILRGMSSIYRRMFGSEPRVESIHAGLECGIIGDRTGGMDMISIGPDIRDVHVPGERVSIPSLQRFWSFLRAVLEDLD